MKLTFIYIFVLLVLVGVVSAQGRSPLVQEPTYGCSIKYPQLDYIPFNTNLELNWHLSNASNGVPLKNNSHMCNFQLYLPNGTHIIDEHNVNYDRNDNEFTYIINKSYLTKSSHSYVFQCNSTLSGCAVEDTIYMENSKPGTTAGILSIFIFLIALPLVVFLSPFLFKNNLQSEYAKLFFKRGAFFLASILTLGTGASMLTIAKQYAPALYPDVLGVFRLLGTLCLIVTFYLLFGTFKDYTDARRIQKEQERGLHE